MRYIVVTDLDGTLLDHKTYEYTPALSAIEKLNQRDMPIVLNSSKTKAEISALRRQLNNHEPYVCENGGIICGMGDIQHLATERSQFLAQLSAIKGKLQLKYRGFAEATVEEVMEWTGLDLASAENAMQRSATEPLLWQDSNSALETLRQELAKIDLQCVKGGRFHHVMGIFNKASCFSRLKQYYAEKWQTETAEIKIVALGDSPNDLPMLEQAEYAIVIPSAKGSNLDPNNVSVYHATQPAPYGWQEGISEFLKNC